MEFLEASDPEWMEIWSELADHPINAGDPICQSANTTWEYMGSTLDHHYLRHEHHPKTDKTEFIYLERRRAAVKWA